MLNPIQTNLLMTDGEKRFVIIEPILAKKDGRIISTGSYKIYKDAFGEESSLFTEPLEFNETDTHPDDRLNPDYLGRLVFAGNDDWSYEGDLLSKSEQEQLAAAITSKAAE